MVLLFASLCEVILPPLVFRFFILFIGGWVSLAIFFFKTRQKRTTITGNRIGQKKDLLKARSSNEMGIESRQGYEWSPGGSERRGRTDRQLSTLRSPLSIGHFAF